MGERPVDEAAMSGTGSSRPGSEKLGTAPQSALREAELEALNYYVAGIGAAMRPAGAGLWFAGGTGRNGGLAPLDARGYALGVLRSDLGADRGLAEALIDAYQAWAAAERPERVLTPRQAEQTIADLARSGDAIRAEDGRAPNATVLSQIDGFLAAEDGIRFAHAADRTRCERLMREVHAPLRALPIYRDATPELQAGLAAAFALTWLRSPQAAARLHSDVERGLHRDVAAVLAAAAGPADPASVSLQTALETFRTLRAAPADSAPGRAWRSVLDDPLALPGDPQMAADRPEAAAHALAVQEWFLRSAQAPAFLTAVAQGTAYGVGRHGPDGSRFLGQGLYAAGGDFALWTEQGEGVAAIDGGWHRFARERLQRLRQRDGGIDIVLEREAGHVLLLRIPGQNTGTAGGSAREEEAQAPVAEEELQGRLASIDPHQLAIEKWSEEQKKVYENVKEKAQELGLPKDRADTLAAHTVASWRENERLVPRVDHVHLSRGVDGDTLVTLAYMQHGMKEPIFTHTASLNHSPAFEQSVARMEQLAQRPTADQQKNLAQDNARQEAHMRQVKDGERTPGQDNIQQVVEGIANPILRGRM